jgi:hypothetical protein
MLQDVRRARGFQSRATCPVVGQSWTIWKSRKIKTRLAASQLDQTRDMIS